MMEAYSVPCAPLTNASTGPGFAPRITATGMEVAASDPAGTSKNPMTFWPAEAVAVPTVKLLCASIAAEQNALRKNRQTILMCFMAGGGLTNGGGVAAQKPF